MSASISSSDNPLRSSSALIADSYPTPIRFRLIPSAKTRQKRSGSVPGTRTTASLSCASMSRMVAPVECFPDARNSTRVTKAIGTVPSQYTVRLFSPRMNADARGSIKSFRHHPKAAAEGEGPAFRKPQRSSRWDLSQRLFFAPASCVLPPAPQQLPGAFSDQAAADRDCTPAIAARITSSTSSGRESIGTWLLSSS